MGESFEHVIDKVFTDVLRPFGFDMAAPNRNAFPGATYVNGNRAVHAYWMPGEGCSVTVRTYGDDPVYIPDVRYFVSDNPAIVSTNDPKVFRSEAERCRDLLLQYCGDFLRGDIGTFRERNRDLMKRFETAD